MSQLNLNIDNLKNSTAYFCPEYGVLQGFANYSGGLGILAGDHLKTASDLEIDLIGIGLMYDSGYFSQKIDENGNQLSDYVAVKRKGFPIKSLKRGKKLKLFELDMPKGKLKFKIWILDYNNTKLLLADTNIDNNKNLEYKKITDKLYGGDREKRIRQEYILGYGMTNALYDLGLEPKSFHINEGHAAFALIAKIENDMKNNNSTFEEAKNKLQDSNVFTTHTPVVHGNEEFKDELVWKYFKKIANKLNLTKDVFLELGKINKNDKDFSMTVLALKLSGNANAVSKLHSITSKKMWKGLWKDKTVDNVPIKAITNGIHLPTWIADNYKKMYDEHLSENWLSKIEDQIWDKINEISVDELDQVKRLQKDDFIKFINEYYKENSPEFLDQQKIDEMLENISKIDNPYIGFARRFAPYKRADLFIEDIDRLKELIDKYNFILILSGKAHPEDKEGKAILKKVINHIQKNDLHKNIVFLENYDIQKGKLLTSTCDIWLNTPFRPMEASGTSGMKAAMNGALNLSILDGWWAEAYNEKNGFAFGNDNEFENLEESYSQANELYDTLEKALEIFKNDRNKWHKMLKNSIITTAEYFSSVRMLKEYNELY